MQQNWRYITVIENEAVAFAPRPLEQEETMSKMAAKMEEATDTMENTTYPAFDTSKATDQMRAFAEKGVEQSKEAYSKMKAGAESTQKAVETTMENARTVGTDLSMKSIAVLRSNAEMGFSHLESLFGAKSLSEIIELQTAFVRKSVEAVVAQSKDMQAATSKAVEDLSKPIEDNFEKSVNEMKVA